MPDYSIHCLSFKDSIIFNLEYFWKANWGHTIMLSKALSNTGLKRKIYFIASQPNTSSMTFYFLLLHSHPIFPFFSPSSQICMLTFHVILLKTLTWVAFKKNHVKNGEG